MIFKAGCRRWRGWIALKSARKRVRKHNGLQNATYDLCGKNNRRGNCRTNVCAPKKAVHRHIVSTFRDEASNHARIPFFGETGDL